MGARLELVQKLAQRECVHTSRSLPINRIFKNGK